jgi:N-acetylated-alpha-linked acidic dipeptidase
MGFNDANAKSQLDWEKQYDAQLNAKNLDTWMQFLTSHPHHVGSPQGKANADYMANLFRSWGYQAGVSRIPGVVSNAENKSAGIAGCKTIQSKIGRVGAEGR